MRELSILAYNKEWLSAKQVGQLLVVFSRMPITSELNLCQKSFVIKHYDSHFVEIDGWLHTFIFT